MGCSVGNQKLINSSHENQKVKIETQYGQEVDELFFNKRLADYSYSSINEFTKSLRYFKNQIPPQNTDTMFVDPFFPPNDNSIFGCDQFGNPIDPSDKRRKDSSKYFKVKPGETEWKRPDEIFCGPYSVFEGKIEAGDSLQGGIGDCYFLSAISAIAEFPQMICQIFKTISLSMNGCYEVALRLNGEWKLIILDDYFPCSKNGGYPIFSRPNGNEIWAMLLEKAWAKVNGGYINIDSGFSIEVLSSLTPFPSEILYHNEHSAETVWEKINQSDKKDEILTCTTSFDESIEKYGLITGHSFTLVTTLEREVNERKVRLLKVRNPWGFKEFSGRYSETSKEWDEETKEKFGDVLVKEDGIFWIELSDYLRFFDETEICKAKHSICVKNIKIDKEKCKYPNVFYLRLDMESNVDISLLRKSYRFNRKILMNESVISNLMLLKIKENNKFDIIATNSSNKKSCIISKKLEKGDYLIFFHVDYNQGVFDKVRKYSIDIASDQFFLLFDKGSDKGFQFLQKIIKLYVEEKGFQKKSHHHILEDCNSGLLDTTYGYLYFKNTSDIVHKLKLIPELKNLYFLDEKLDSLTKKINDENIEISLTPNESFVLLTNAIDFHKDAELSLNYTKFHTNSVKYNHSSSKTLEGFLSHYTCDPEQNADNEYTEYSFIYNKMKFDMGEIINHINHKEVALKNMMKKYPEDMEELLKLPPLDDNEDVVFRDRLYFGEDYYFGEQHYVSMIRHGRGKYYWKENGVIFIGYSIKGQFNGKGKLIFPNGEIYEGKFRNGVMMGKGRRFRNGKWEEAEFPL